MSAISLFIPLLCFATVFAVVLGVSDVLRRGDNRLRKRIDAVGRTRENEERSLLREQYLQQLAPWERTLETLPGMEAIARLLAQTGRFGPGYRWALLCLALSVLAAAVVMVFTARPGLAFLAAVVVLPLPLLRLIKTRNERRTQFEEQLPDALDSMSRALRAGSPFQEALKLVAEEMDDPIATEFGLTYADINYGGSVKGALTGLLERVPDISMAVVVTAVLVQRETGGNMAEVLEKVATILRGRHRFRRRLRTLTAEGRMSAWILIAVPFALAGMLTVTSPQYLPMMLDDPLGTKMLVAGVVLLGLGIFWIRRTVRLDI